MIISVILSWVAPGSHNPAQSWSPDLRAGAGAVPPILPNLGGLDISPIFAFIALKLIDMLVISGDDDDAGNPAPAALGRGRFDPRMSSATGSPQR
jgi:hypothetical protein